MDRFDSGSLEISDLEYDVAGVGAEEAADTQINHAAFVICVVPLK